MFKKLNLRFKFVPFAAIVALSGSILLALMITSNKKSFPALRTGAYVGKLSGISDNDKEFNTLYIERIGNSDAVLFVAFKEGWKPLVLPLKAVTEKGESRVARYQPLEINYNNNTFSLYGTASGGDYLGEIISANGKRGVWTISEISADQLREDSQVKMMEADLQKWLKSKEKYEALQTEKKQLDTILSDQDEKLASLTKHITEESKLRDRAQTRINNLKTEISDIGQSSKKSTLDVRRHVSELEQLLRITKTGRTIDLARRAAKRENKWYEANWQKGADLSGIEESLANKMNVDLRKLGKNVKKAKEFQNLENTITRERKRVKKLEKMYRDKVRGATEPESSPTPAPENNKKKRPWWKKVERVFG